MTIESAKYMLLGQGGKAPEKYWMNEVFVNTTSSFGNNFEDGNIPPAHVSKNGDVYFTWSIKDDELLPTYYEGHNNVVVFKISKEGDLEYIKNTYLHANNDPSSGGSHSEHYPRGYNNGGGKKGTGRSDKLMWEVELYPQNQGRGAGVFEWDTNTDEWSFAGAGGSNWARHRYTKDKDGNIRSTGRRISGSSSTRTGAYVYGANGSTFKWREYNNTPVDIACDGNDNTYVVGHGYFGGSSNQENMQYIIKLDSSDSNSYDWFRRHYPSNTSTSMNREIPAVTCNGNNDVYALFHSFSSSSHKSGVVVKFDSSDGSVDKWYGIKDDEEYGVPHSAFDVDDDGNVYTLHASITKIELGSNNGDAHCWFLIKRNASGTVQFTRLIIGQYNGASSTDTSKIISNFGGYQNQLRGGITVYNDSIYLSLPSAERINTSSENNYTGNYRMMVNMKVPIDGSGHSTTPRQLGRSQVIYSDTSIRGSNIDYDFGYNTSSSGMSNYGVELDTDWSPTSDTSLGSGSNGLDTYLVSDGYRSESNWTVSTNSYTWTGDKYDFPD